MRRRMMQGLSLAGLGALLLAAGAAAQAPQPQMPKGQMPDLGRPTKPDDQAPPLNFDAYFPGKWTFEWDVPEGPLGPAGRVTGTTTYKKVDGRFYQADTEASGPGGSFALHELIAYHVENKIMSRYVTDSRGFSYMQIATVGGDLGGVYYVYFESAPFSYKGHTVRIKHNLRLLSPLNYRVAVSVSDNGGPFVNYGNPWWRKDAAAE